ncbi:MAG: pyridoxal phosphate-dependent aminotransferase [Clostridia bacterium]|nr:pyridoxal phosphate-dependent aminotransferase [Clostridia bacterium]
MYDFDRVVDRHGTNSLKWDFAVERGQAADALPLWVADMDFPVAPCIQEALQRVVSHGIFGYSDVKGDYYEAVAGWYEKRHQWRPAQEWLVKTPGVVCALAMAVQALTELGESVLIQPPVYYPFYEVIRDNDRRIVISPLTLREGRYEIDFADFERVIVESGARLFILCNPHNPVGRVWTQEELQRLADICLRHGVRVVSDEIHCDLILPGYEHQTLLRAAPELRDQVLICTAASKSFNLAGLQVSNIWIPNPELRQAFVHRMNASGYSQLNPLGLAATKAAYLAGEEWLAACQAYLTENLNFFRESLKKELPQLQLIEPQGTYFAWVDFRDTGLTGPEVNNLVSKKAKLWLDAGDLFGQEGAGFQRFVLATQRETLAQAVSQLAAACRDRKD